MVGMDGYNGREHKNRKQHLNLKLWIFIPYGIWTVLGHCGLSTKEIELLSLNGLKPETSSNDKVSERRERRTKTIYGLDLEYTMI